MGALLGAACLGLGVFRVVALERAELESASPFRPPARARGPGPELVEELLRVELQRGERVLFELCTGDGLEPARWAGALELVVFHPATEELVVRVPLDEELLGRARRSRSGSCVVFARAESIEAGGLFSILASWPEGPPGPLGRVPVRVRVLADRPLTVGDLWTIVLLMAGSVLVVLGLARPRGPERAAAAAPSPGEPEDRAPGSRLALARLAAGLTGLLAAGALVGLVPLGGAVAGFGRGLVLAAVQVSLALGLSTPGPSRRAALGLVAPRSAALLWLAPLVGFGLWLVGRSLVAAVPSTSEAPIETLVSWPSGQLAVSLVGVLVPIAEEVFFRGFVYGLARRHLGPAAAFVLTVALFTAAHLPQAWGAWGGLAAVLVTGLGLTALRAASGSVVVPALAHLAHNGAIALFAAVLGSLSR